MEIVMVITLAIMGVYFFKSTDLPKDLRERSAQFQNSSIDSTRSTSFKITFPKEIINKEIDQLTLEITTLEQELRANNEKNKEIQTLINTRLTNLESLYLKVNQLA